MKTLPSRISALLVTVAALFAAFPASAQGLFRAYVSSTGSDANPCNLPSPCRLLPAALTAVADGGEIWMLDSANFNGAPVNVTKSVTILAIPGAVGSVVANGGNAINVNGAGIKVTLRNLVIIHFASSADGVSFVQGSQLLVEGCEIANVLGNGINAQASGGRLLVRNTVIRGVGLSGVSAGNGVTASLNGIHIERVGGDGVTIVAPSTIAVSDTVLAANVTGIGVVSTTSAVQLTVERSLFAQNNVGINAACTGPCSAVGVNLVGNFFNNNLIIANTDNANLTLTFDRNVLFGSPVTVTGGTPTLYTLGNNTLASGSSVTGGTLTPLAAQ
jgi:hypothetical protein